MLNVDQYEFRMFHKQQEPLVYLLLLQIHPKTNLKLNIKYLQYNNTLKEKFIEIKL